MDAASGVDVVVVFKVDLRQVPRRQLSVRSTDNYMGHVVTHIPQRASRILFWDASR